MKRTDSGDYKLPGRFSRALGTIAINLTGLVPGPIRERLVLHKDKFYQSFDDDLSEGAQGSSQKKWEAIAKGCDVRGKSVLDIGCAEGFFCRQAARNGARDILGVDTRLRSLISARALALKEKLSIRYEVGVFPTMGFTETFDVVFCLSVLHHLVSTKDIWKVLSDANYAADLQKLRGYLKFLRGITRPAGVCVIEMPFEYDDPSEREQVDFGLFSRELRNCGFASACQLGSWDYNKEHEAKKDRIIYVANTDPMPSGDFLDERPQGSGSFTQAAGSKSLYTEAVQAALLGNLFS